jgi:hypothetical protein
MIIDENDEQTSIIEEKKSILSGLTTINSLVEKEISKTLQQTEKRLANNNNKNISPDKILPPQPPPSTTTTINQPQPPPPPPLVTLTKSRSPTSHSHNQQTYLNKGSIMRGTPISPSNKPIPIDISPSHSHHYSNPKNEYSHHPSAYHDSPHMKSSKVSDQQQLYLQQQQQQQQAAYMRHYSHNNFPTQYLQQQQQQQQQHKLSPNNNQQTSTNTNKSIGIDTSNTDTYETLRADFVTSRYLTTTHSPNHER